jgi:hypothetical protein
MTVRYSIDRQRRLILSTAEGCVTLDDLKDHQERLLADPRFDPSFDQLIDATGITKLDISADQVRTFASRRIFSAASRRAIVAAEPHIFGVGRMMEIYHEDAARTAAAVFYSMDDALKWLARGE